MMIQEILKLKTLNYLKTLNFPLSGFPDKNISDSIKYFLIAAWTRMLSNFGNNFISLTMGRQQEKSWVGKNLILILRQ